MKTINLFESNENVELKKFAGGECHVKFLTEFSEEDKVIINTRLNSSDDLMNLCLASIGRQHNAYIPLESPKEVFAGDILDPKKDVAILAAIAYTHQEDFSKLLDTKQILDIAQAYANGGINFIEEELLKRPGRPLNNLVNLLMD